MNENNKNQGQGQRTGQGQSGDMNKPQKQGGMGEKPVQNKVSGETGMPDANKGKNPGQGGQGGQGGKTDINQGPGDRQTSSNPNKLDNDVDDDKATQRTQRPNLDRDDQK